MRRAILLLLFLIIPLLSFSDDKPVVTLFYSPRCHACIKLKEEFLPFIKQIYKNKVVWKERNITNDPQGVILLYQLSEQFKKKRAVTPSILIGNFFLTGRREIEEKLEMAIVVSLRERRLPLPILEANIKELFKKVSLAAVMLSGLIDGVNPCAFAVIVFFVSFLAVYGYRRREIAYVGSSYCLAVFITYLILGLGFLNFLYSLTHIYFFIKLFYYFVAFFCFALFGLALYDYFKFKKTKTTEGAVLQLPKFLKKRIPLVIGAHLREKGGRSIWGLAAASFIVGIIVSLLEAACTGQVYLPTIVFILKRTSIKSKALLYLVLYNLMFILPLLVIFALSLAGFSSQKFNAFLKKNIGKIKIIMALLFLSLGIFILLLS